MANEQVQEIILFGVNVNDHKVLCGSSPQNNKNLTLDDSINFGLRKLKATALSSKVTRPKNRGFIKSLFSRKAPKRRGRRMCTAKQSEVKRPFSPSGKNYYGVAECGQRPKSPTGHIFDTASMPPTSAESLRDRTMQWVNTLKSFLAQRQ